MFGYPDELSKFATAGGPKGLSLAEDEDDDFDDPFAGDDFEADEDDDADFIDDADDDEDDDFDDE